MQFESLILHDMTRTLLRAYVRHPKQGLLLAGPIGSGLFTAARAAAGEITTHRSAIMVVRPDEKGTVSIERVRNLYVETRGVRSERFVIIIDDADSMSHDAQNAFLKLLEEPVDNVYFILTTHEPSRLLPTILSRVQRIDMARLTKTASESLLRAHRVALPAAIQQMLFIAEGLPAELTRLAGDKDHFESKARLVRLARDFLTAGAHDRLTVVSQVTSREEALAFTATIASVLGFTSRRDPYVAADIPAEVLETATARLAMNGHVKTQLMYLAVNA